MRLYITDTGQLKLYKDLLKVGMIQMMKVEVLKRDMGDRPNSDIQNPPTMSSWQNKDYIETGDNNYLGIGDYITSNNGKFRFYIKR